MEKWGWQIGCIYESCDRNRLILYIYIFFNEGEKSWGFIMLWWKSGVFCNLETCEKKRKKRIKISYIQNTVVRRIDHAWKIMIIIIIIDDNKNMYLENYEITNCIWKIINHNRLYLKRKKEKKNAIISMIYSIHLRFSLVFHIHIDDVTVTNPFKYGKLRWKDLSKE